MSDNDNADRLNRAWDDFVQRPSDARQNDNVVDPTIRDIHGMGRPQSPDPEFRAQLRKQLERQAAFRSGQQLRTGVQSVPAQTTQDRVTSPIPIDAQTRGARLIEILAIAALLALVGSAIFWAVEFRPSNDEPTVTIEMAATVPAVISASPGVEPSTVAAPSATVEPTDPATSEPSPSATDAPTGTAESTATETPDSSSAVTTKPSASATAVPIACIAVAETFDGLLGPIAVPALAPDLSTAVPADTTTVRQTDAAFSGLIDCLAGQPQSLRRIDVLAALEGSDVDSLSAFAIGQDIDMIVRGRASLTDHRTLSETSAVATLSIDGIPEYLVLFVIDPGTTEWHVASLSLLPAATPTQAPTSSGDGSGNAPADDNSGSNSGNGDGSVPDNDGDDDSASGDDSGGDDDDGDDSGGDDDDGGGDD